MRAGLPEFSLAPGSQLFLEGRKDNRCQKLMAEAPLRHRKHRKPLEPDPTVNLTSCCSNSAGPSHSFDSGKPAGRRRRQCVVPCSLELTRVPLLTGSSGQVEGGVRHYSLSSEEGEMSVQTLDSPGGTVGRRRRHSNGDGGAVVDLTNDSGVEDEDVVDLTSPIRLPVIVPGHEFRPNYFQANPHGGGQGQCTTSPEVVIVQESDDDIQVISSTRGPIAGMSSPKKPKHASHSSPMPVPEPTLPSTKSTLTCPICMETAQQFESRGCKLVTTICGHVFCNSCIRNAIQGQHKCPTCRKKLTLKQYHELFVS